jgi:hypothetical protein
MHPSTAAHADIRFFDFRFGVEDERARLQESEPLGLEEDRVRVVGGGMEYKRVIGQSRSQPCLLFGRRLLKAYDIRRRVGDQLDHGSLPGLPHRQRKIARPDTVFLPHDIEGENLDRGPGRVSDLRRSVRGQGAGQQENEFPDKPAAAMGEENVFHRQLARASLADRRLMRPCSQFKTLRFQGKAQVNVAMLVGLKERLLLSGALGLQEEQDRPGVFGILQNYWLEFRLPPAA